MDNLILTEDFSGFIPNILESGPNKPLKMEGIVGLGNYVNENNRYYSESVLRNALESPKLKTMLKEGRCLGELGHPKPEVGPQLERASHKWLNFVLDTKEDKRCPVCESGHGPHVHLRGTEVVLSTPYGNVLKSLVNDGVKVEASSRGSGKCTESTMNGRLVNVVEDGYSFDSVDHVLYASATGAHTLPVSSINGGSTMNAGMDDVIISAVGNLLSENCSVNELQGYKNVVSDMLETYKGSTKFVSNASSLIESIDVRISNYGNTSVQVPKNYGSWVKDKLEVNRMSETKEHDIQSLARELAASEVQRVRDEYERRIAEAVSTIDGLQDELEAVNNRYARAESIGKELLSQVKELQIKNEAYKDHIEQELSEEEDEEGHTLSEKFEVSKKIIDELVGRVQRLMVYENRSNAAEKLLGETIARIRRDRLVSHVDNMLANSGLPESVRGKIKPIILEATTAKEANEKFATVYSVLSEGLTKEAPVGKGKVLTNGALPKPESVTEQTLSEKPIEGPDENDELDEATYQTKFAEGLMNRLLNG
jgi:predicted  nucleic acid-binding Zn-ribbon protein